MKIYIIIPVFNRWHFTKPCLDSLRKQTYRDFQVVVVDHGSTDGTRENITNDYPWVKLILGEENMWWTAATNHGVRFALTQKNVQFILTLNNDTIAAPDYLLQLIKASNKTLQRSLIGSTAVQINTNQVIYRGEEVRWHLDSSFKLDSLFKQRPKDGLIKVSYFPGRGLLIPLIAFQNVGLFDDKSFPHYLADYDFTLRAKKRGFQIYCAWDAIIATYPEASGANLLIKKKSLKHYYQHLFGLRGGGNLPYFYKFAFRHCPIYALPSCLLIGTMRCLIGYWFK